MSNIKYLLAHKNQQYTVCVCQTHLLGWLIKGWEISLEYSNDERYIKECFNCEF